MSSEVVIRISHVCKKYQCYNTPADRLWQMLFRGKRNFFEEHQALKNIDFELSRGEVLGIVGHNGSGKSTLLQIIAGIIPPTSGAVSVNGRVAALLELGAGFNPEFSGKENVFMNAQLLGLSEVETADKYEEIVRFADIGVFIDRPVKTYSSGMYVRLAFAVAAMVEPDVLIVDEALSVGDVRFQKKCIDRINELKSGGTTILFVSHATEQIKRFCDRALWINEGEMKEIGEVSAVCDRYESHALMQEQRVVTEIESASVAEKLSIPIPDKPACLNEISVEHSSLKVFDEFRVEIKYEIFDESVNAFLLGVAIRRAGDDLYLSGPNTDLDKVSIPNIKGEHQVSYLIPRMTLLAGSYYIDVGIFTDQGLVCIDYDTKVIGFTIEAEYFTEGLLHIDHEWIVNES
jgi:teichoic acid transport system ATP-binding protein